MDRPMAQDEMKKQAALAALEDPPETTNNPRVPLTISVRSNRPPADPANEPAEIA